MTKKDLIWFLESFDDEIEIRVDSRGIAFPSKPKYIPAWPEVGEEYAYVMIVEDI